jgi:hypothetical protein
MALENLTRRTSGVRFMIPHVPSKPSLAFVAFASIRADATTPDLGQAIAESLTPGKSVLRYNRLWRLPKHTRREGFIYGRIGFEYPNSSVGVWNEQAKDYRSIRPAQITPYVIHAASGQVAFELKSSTIKPWTFQTNFQALLNKDSAYRWRVILEELTYPSWEDWEKSVRITDIRIRMERPNPRYKGKRVEDVLEGAKASAATLAVHGDDIDPDDSSFVSQALEHAKRYGHISAKGLAGSEKREWQSEDGGTVDREQAPRDPATRAVAPKWLRQLLEQRHKVKPAK